MSNAGKTLENLPCLAEILLRGSEIKTLITIIVIKDKGQRERELLSRFNS